MNAKDAKPTQHCLCGEFALLPSCTYPIYEIYGWGEPDNIKRLEVLPRDTYVPGNLYGEVWEVTWTREHVWRHYYIVEYDCEKTRTYPCTDANGNATTCTETYIGTCTRTEYYEMATNDTRVDRVAVTLKAKENSKTSICLDYTDTT